MKLNKNIASVALLFAVTSLLFTLSSCGRRYAKGKYIPAGEVILRSDKFVEADLQMIAEKLTGSLLSQDDILNSGKPTVLMSLMVNDTDEHIDMKSLSDKIRTLLFKSKKMKFINETLRPTVKEEIEYEEGDFVDPQTAKRRGHQVGADYLVSGSISSIKQPVGRQEVVYYKVTLELTDLSTNIIAWTDEIEIKKLFRKRATGF